MDTSIAPPPSLTPIICSIESLLLKAGLLGQQKLSEKVDQVVRVKGTVSRVNRYQHVMYVTLREREFTITLKCNSDHAVYEGDQIIIEGNLSLRPSTFISGLECYIDGSIVGSWELTNKQRESDFVPLKKKRFLNLEDLFNEIDVASILIVGTETGINDVTSQLNSQLANSISQVRIRVGRSESLIEDLKKASLHNYKAFVIARGGDDSTMEIWNDPNIVSFLLSFSIPFFTALGHSHSRTLADQYADGSYHTPTAFGAALNSILIRKRKFSDMESEYMRLKTEYLSLANRPQDPANVERKYYWFRIILALSVYTGIIFLIFDLIRA